MTENLAPKLRSALIKGLDTNVFVSLDGAAINAKKVGRKSLTTERYRNSFITYNALKS